MSRLQVAAVVILRPADGYALLALRSENSHAGAGRWCLPGGKCEGDEYHWRAACREVNEEVGLVIPPGTLAEVFTVEDITAYNDTRFDIHYFWTENFTGAPAIVEPTKCDGVRWFDPRKALPELMPHDGDAIVKAVEMWAKARNTPVDNELHTNYDFKPMVFMRANFRSFRVKAFLEWLRHKNFKATPGDKTELIGSEGVELWVAPEHEAAIREYMRQEHLDEQNESK